MITQKANNNQPWNGPPGTHEDCDTCEHIHTKMEYHLIHQCAKETRQTEAKSKDHKRKRTETTASNRCTEQSKKHNGSDGCFPQ